MKKYLLISLAVLTASCSKVETNETPEGNRLVPMTFSADASAVKTTLNDHTITWNSGDCISIFDGEGNRQFTTTGSGSNATFTGEAASGATEFYALYPYSASASLSSGTILTTLPAVQDAVDGSFADDLFIMACKAGKESLGMKNVCSIVKLTIGQDGVYSSVSLKGNNNENLAGAVSISFGTDGEPSVEVTSGEKEVSLKPSGATLAAGTYYLAIVPTTFSNGITLDFVRASDSAKGVNSKSVAVSIERSRILALGTVDTNIVWADKFAGSGTESDPYQITSYEDLKLLSELCTDTDNGAKYRSAWYLLTTDIDGGQLNDDFSVKSGAEAFHPICKSGTSSMTFQGKFNGGNHTISGLYIKESAQYAGLFGVLRNATVRDLTVIANVSNTGTDTGIIAGYFGSNCRVENCISKGIATSTSTTDASRVAGIVGRGNATSAVVGCTNYATISSAGGYCGGIEGQHYGIVDGCTNYGTVNANRCSGGLSGYLNNGAILVNSHNAGEVNITVDNAGGICGYISYGCTVANNWNSASVSAQSAMGALVGYIKNTAVEGYAQGTLENCYSTGTLNIQAVGKFTDGPQIRHCYFLTGTCSKVSGTTSGGSNNGNFTWKNDIFTLNSQKTFSDIVDSDTYKTNNLLDALNHYVQIKTIEGVTLRSWEIVGTPAENNFPVLQ